MSFLEKLKVKVEENEPTQAGDEEDELKTDNKEEAGFLQLDVEIFQTNEEIFVIAPIPGADPGEIDISVENENDVVTIQGERAAPVIENIDENKKTYLRQEFQWGPFYRQIILPQEINVSEVEAKFKKGILILRLPLLRLQAKGKKKIEVGS